MPRRLCVDMEYLLQALGCTSLAQEAFLDLAQGTVIVLSNTDYTLEEQENCFFLYKSRPARYRHIPHTSQRELHQTMLEFASTVEDADRAYLTQILKGKQSISRFYAALDELPAIAKKWQAFHRRHLLERARHWLAREGIIADNFQVKQETASLSTKEGC
ncbi:MAG: UPF0158 family protein [bacterium]